jgi:hypothetical protein
MSETYQIQVRCGFDGEGFRAAMHAYLTGLVESGEAKYDQATYDLLVAHAEQISGAFITTKTVTVKSE